MIRKFLPFLLRDAADSGAGSPPNPPAPAPDAPPPPPPPAPPAPAAPPAAHTVATAQRTEREISLQAELDTERTRHATTAAEKKDRETRIAELEDELHRLKATPTPAPRKRKPSFGWFEEED
jgi:colicin import membrane protein